MDRRNFYFKQRVTDSELNGADDAIEQALWNLAEDAGIFGIIAGGVVTEQAPPALAVDMTGPFVGYTQNGERVFIGIPQAIDCSVDYLGNATVPASVGQSRWISIHARFDRSESDPRVDGNGNAVNFVSAESFELRVVSGVAAPTGTEVKPAKPSDALLVCDINLDNGQTQIVNADIDASRRDTFVFSGAAAISVDGSPFTKLSTLIDDVQEALEAIDVELIDRNGSGQLEQDLIPDVTRNLGGVSNRWALFATSIDLSGSLVMAGGSITGVNTVEIGAAITATSNGLPIGDATNRFDAHIEDGTVYNALVPDANAGASLGSASLRFLAHAEDLTIYNALKASADGKALGDATNRFLGYFSGINMYGGISATTPSAYNIGSSGNPFNQIHGNEITSHGTGTTGRFVLDSAESRNKFMPMGCAVPLTTASWSLQIVDPHWQETDGDSLYLLIPLVGIPDGATITNINLRVLQTVNVAQDMSANLYEADSDGQRTSLGSVVLSSFGAATNINIASLSVVVNNATHWYNVTVRAAGAGSGINEVRACLVTYNVTDVGRGAVN